MNGEQFLKRARQWANAKNLEFRVRSALGKGGHQVVHVGDRLTIVKSGEIGSGLLHAMPGAIRRLTDGSAYVKIDTVIDALKALGGRAILSDEAA